mmetsp:Transcript_51402/g.149292  ORF Transcript_51402/g.149292 Transcript_51402/m.149292 type:complete len:245 (-) Transcript_51402:198-932(-)
MRAVAVRVLEGISSRQVLRPLHRFSQRLPVILRSLALCGARLRPSFALCEGRPDVCRQLLLLKIILLLRLFARRVWDVRAHEDLIQRTPGELHDELILGRQHLPSLGDSPAAVLLEDQVRVVVQLRLVPGDVHGLSDLVLAVLDYVVHGQVDRAHGVDELVVLVLPVGGVQQEGLDMGAQQEDPGHAIPAAERVVQHARDVAQEAVLRELDLELPVEVLLEEAVERGVLRGVLHGAHRRVLLEN